MYVHMGQKIVLILPPRTASRIQAQTAKDKDFVCIGNHHTGPDSVTYQEGSTSMFWWESDPMLFTYYTPVRNHFDAISTHFAILNKPKPKLDHAKVYDGPKIHTHFLEVFRFSSPEVWKHREHLWRWVHEVPGISLLRFENIRDDFDKMLQRNNLPKLEPWEFQHYPSFKTGGKPRDWWNMWTEDTIKWAEDVFGYELHLLKYSFPYERLGKTYDEVFPSEEKNVSSTVLKAV